MEFKTLAISVALASLTSLAMAASAPKMPPPFQGHWYVGAGATINEGVSINGTEYTTSFFGTATDSDRFDETKKNAWGAKLYAGYQFKPWAALQLSLTRPGNVTITRNNQAFTTSVDKLTEKYWLFDLDGVAALHIWRGLFATTKLGATLLHETDTASNLANFGTFGISSGSTKTSVV